MNKYIRNIATLTTVILVGIGMTTVSLAASTYTADLCIDPSKASATSFTPDHGPSFAFDNSANGVFYPNTSWWSKTIPSRISYDFESTKLIRKYTLKSINGDLSYSPKEWTFVGSNDGTNWDVLDTQANAAEWAVNEKREYVLDNSKAYRFYGFNFKAPTGNLGMVIVDEIEMMEEVGYVPPSTSTPTLDLLASKERMRVGDTVTVDAILKNVNNIYAEDFVVNYDATKFEYLGHEEIAGYKVMKTVAEQDNQLRFIIVSKGKTMGITGEKAVVRLKFKAKASGTAKVDATKGKIADVNDEYDLKAENCLEVTVIIEGLKDVNRSGAYSLVDLAIDGFYYNMTAAETDLTKHDADQDMNSTIDDLDLSIIVEEMLNNSNYRFTL